MSSHYKPIELQEAAEACGKAWAKVDELIEAGKPTADAIKRAEELTDSYHSLYIRWQELGGTSDIRSIALDAQLDGCENDADLWYFARGG